MKRTTILFSPYITPAARAGRNGVRALDELSETASAQNGRPAPRIVHDAIGISCTKTTESEPHSALMKAIRSMLLLRVGAGCRRCCSHRQLSEKSVTA